MRKYLKTALFSAFVLSLLGMARIPAHAADISVISVSFPSNIDIDVGSPTDSAGTGTIQNNNSNKVDISFLGIKSSDETSPKVVTPEDDKNYWSNLTPSQTESIINLGFKIGETPYWSPAQTQNSPTNPVGNVITLAPNDTKALTPIARHGLQWTKDAGLNYAAYFRIQPYCKVNVIAGEGGTVTGGGEYKTGSTVTLSASPNSGYKFTDWTCSDGEKSSDSSFSYTVTDNVTWTANFEGTYDCRARVVNGTCGYSKINEDGSGRLGGRNHYYDDPAHNVETHIDFYFDEPVSFQLMTSDEFYNDGSSSDVPVIPVSRRFLIVGSSVGNSGTLANWDDAYPALYAYMPDYKKIGTAHYPDDDSYTLNSKGLWIHSTGTATHFVLTVNSLILEARKDDEGYLYWTWPAGGLRIFGHQINHVKLID